MSIEIILVTMALTAAAGWVARRNRAKRAEKASICFETQFKDGNLILAALNDFGCTSTVSGAQIQTTYNEMTLIFDPDEQGIFNAYSVGKISEQDVQSFLYDLHAQYRRQVQQQSYETLLQRAEAQGMILENEELTEDNSIVLTFTVS